MWAMTPILQMSAERPLPAPRKKKSKLFGFEGYFSIFLFLTIVTAVIIWILYGYFPYEYYLPGSILTLVVFGIFAYVILSRSINIS